MFCRNCGNELYPGTKYCSNCGKISNDVFTNQQSVNFAQERVGQNENTNGILNADVNTNVTANVNDNINANQAVIPRRETPSKKDILINTIIKRHNVVNILWIIAGTFLVIDGIVCLAVLGGEGVVSSLVYFAIGVIDIINCSVSLVNAKKEKMDPVVIVAKHGRYSFWTIYYNGICSIFILVLGVSTAFESILAGVIMIIPPLLIAVAVFIECVFVIHYVRKHTQDLLEGIETESLKETMKGE